MFTMICEVPIINITYSSIVEESTFFSYYRMIQNGLEEIIKRRFAEEHYSLFADVIETAQAFSEAGCCRKRFEIVGCISPNADSNFVLAPWSSSPKEKYVVYGSIIFLVELLNDEINSELGIALFQRSIELFMERICDHQYIAKSVDKWYVPLIDDSRDIKTRAFLGHIGF